MKCIFILLALLLGGCLAAKTEQAVKNEVVIIFDHAPIQKTIYLSDTDTTSSSPRMGSDLYGVFYIDSAARRIHFVPNSDIVDTLVVPTFGSVAEVSYGYRVLETIDFLFQAGDTIKFTYGDDKYPAAICINNRSRDALYNARGSERMANKYSPYTVLTSYQMASLARIKQQGDAEKYSRFLKFSSYIYCDIDTLIDAYKRSKTGYNSLLASIKESAYVNRAKYVEQLRDGKAQKAINLYKSGSAAEITGDELESLYSCLNDDMLYSIAYQSGVLTALQTVLGKRYGTHIKFTNYGGGGGGSFTDMRAVFDTVCASKRITPASKKVLLRKITEQMFGDFASEYTIADEIAYKRKFAAATGDTIFAFSVNDLENSLKTSCDLLLIGVNGQKTTLDSLIKSLCGKVVYVDYWGSGCAPCLRAMPASAKLRRQFSGREVAFVYLSYDNDVNLWRETIKKYDIGGLNYIMTNLRAAEVRKKLKIFEFPRYMLYNKAGLLVQNRAAAPSDAATASLIEKYL